MTLVGLVLGLDGEWRTVPGIVLLTALGAAAVVGAWAMWCLFRLTAPLEDSLKAYEDARRTGNWEGIGVDDPQVQWFIMRAGLRWFVAVAIHLGAVAAGALAVTRVGLSAEDREPGLWWQTVLLVLVVQLMGFVLGVIFGCLASSVRQLLGWSRTSHSGAERLAFRAAVAVVTILPVTAVAVGLVSEDRSAARRRWAVLRDVVSVFDDPVSRGVTPALAAAAQIGVGASAVSLLVLVVAGVRFRRAQAAERRSR